MSDLRLERREGVARLVLSRPERRNAFVLAGIEEFEDRLRELEREPPRLLVVTGEGSAFSAGGDLRAAAESGNAAAALGALAERFHAMLRRLCRFPAPVLMLVNGAAAGGGFALALAGDLRWATEGAVFRLGYARAGLSVDGGTSWRLPRIVGWAQAQRILVEDPDLDAAEALRIGLVHRVVSGAAAEEAIAQLAARLRLQGPGALARNKELLAAGATGSLDEAFDREARSMAETAGRGEGQEGISAFLEKRAARFSRS